MSGHVFTGIRKGFSNGSYYTSNFLNYLFVPRIWYQHRLEKTMSAFSSEQIQLMKKRADYYNKLASCTPLNGGVTVGDYHFPYRKYVADGKARRFTSYFNDQYRVMKYFPSHYRFRFIHGDVTQIPSHPTFVKSRPIGNDNENAVILKLDSRRHFQFVKDNLPFSEKKDMLVSRTTWCNARPWRRLFCEMFWNHSMCNVGKSQPEVHEDFPESVKGFMSIEEQLQYKFIACIEGIDVATNLKWVMSSNSIAVSAPMKFETWFMEGTLIPNYHYIEVKPDYSDLIEKLNYYISHQDKAEAIIKHAHEYVSMFMDESSELATQLLVAKKYFTLTNSQL